MKHAWSLFLFLSYTASAANLHLTSVLTDLTRPVLVTHAPGEPSALYVVEQDGRILRWENGVRTTFLDLRSQVVSGGERGLLGLAFHPQFQENGRFFVNYTANRPGLTSVLSEFVRGAAEEKELLTVAQPFANHNGGHLAFDAAGLLYASFGDGGGVGDSQGNGQNTQTLLGTILRLDVDTHGDSAYAIPDDNPFAQGGGRPEIFAYGLRNVWRFSFDRLTQALFAGDVGQGKEEEIDLIEKGQNYGWKTMEGFSCFSPAVGCSPKGLTLPLFSYPRTEGKSITGGYVYRGTALPSLQGVYVYGDYLSGKIWGLSVDLLGRRALGNELLLSTGLPISSFGEDSAGELYVVSYTGTVYRLAFTD